MAENWTAAGVGMEAVCRAEADAVAAVAAVRDALWAAGEADRAAADVVNNIRAALVALYQGGRDAGTVGEIERLAAAGAAAEVTVWRAWGRAVVTGRKAAAALLVEAGEWRAVGDYVAAAAQGDASLQAALHCCWSAAEARQAVGRMRDWEAKGRAATGMAALYKGGRVDQAMARAAEAAKYADLVGPDVLERENWRAVYSWYNGGRRAAALLAAAE